MNKIFFSLSIFLFVVSYKIYAQWQTFYTSTNSAYNEVCVVDHNIIWAAGYNSVVVRTTNGGLIWVNVNNGLPANFSMNHISAFDANTAWVSGSIGGYFGRIFKTTNGGQMWFEQTFADTSYINKIHFFNANTGIILKEHLYPPMYDTASFYISRDGGAHWYHPPHQPIVSAIHDNALNVLDTNFVYFINWRYLYILRNGLDNVFQTYPLIGYGQYAAAFTDSLNGIAAGFTDTVYKTTNGGVNWSMASKVTRGYYTLSITAVPDTYWYLISGTNFMLLTYNFGAAFLSQAIFNPPDSTRIGFSNAKDTNSFWVPATSGRLFKYNYAYIGLKQISSEVPAQFVLYQNYPNPFNPETKIGFEIPKTSDVLFRVYNSLGKEVYRLDEQNKQPGKYELSFNGNSLASGIYFYKITARQTDGGSSTRQVGSTTGDYIQTKKMVLLK